MHETQTRILKAVRLLNDTGSTTDLPSIHTTLETFGGQDLAQSTTYYHLTKLVKAGELEVSRQKSNKAGRPKNIYSVPEVDENPAETFLEF